MFSEERSRDLFFRTVDQVRRGDTAGASATLCEGCGMVTAESVLDTMNVYAMFESLIVVGTEVCAVAIRERAGDPQPWLPPADDVVLSLQLGTPDGQHVSFEEAGGNPCCATALRCVTAGLNGDLTLLSDVLKAHTDTHGPQTMIEIVADLISLYLTFEANPK